MNARSTAGRQGNFVDVPTDCPQRDERLGWTGDIQVFVRTAAFNMDVAGFMTKWAWDVADAQSDQGAAPPVVPKVGLPLDDGGPAWADAAIICPGPSTYVMATNASLKRIMR
jgi:alpha-L-rhamnosidase